MDRRTIDSETKPKFVDALLACSAMADRHTRDTIVDKLTKVKGQIRRSETARVDIANIVDRALDFEGGFAELLDVLRFYEGDSIPMQDVDTLVSGQGVEIGHELPMGKQPNSPTAQAIKTQFAWPILSLLLCILLFFIGWGVWEWFGESRDSGIVSSTTDETLILVTEFYLADGIDDAEPHRKIVRAIQDKINENELKNVRVEMKSDVVLREDEKDAARKLAERYNASIIIWGDETSTDITVRFLNLRQPDYAISYVTIKADDQSVHKAALANPTPYINFVSQNLPDQLTFLALFALAQSEYNQQEYERAIMLCELAIQYKEAESIEGLSEVYLYLGWLYQTLIKDNTQSILYYNKAIELNPKFVAAYNNLSTQSILYYNKAIELDFNFFEAYNNRGIAYGLQGKYKQALADFDRAIALNPGEAMIYNNRGIAYGLRGKYEQALDDFDRAIALEPDEVMIYNNQEIVHELLENVAESIIGSQRSVVHISLGPAADADYVVSAGGVVSLDRPPPALFPAPSMSAIYRYVPAGDFVMGSSDEQVDFAIELCATYRDDCSRDWYTDERPQHTVYLDAYWIMETEVTNAQYRRFMDAGGYTIEIYWSTEGWAWRDTKTEPGCWDDDNYNGDEQPVVCISWYEAEAYANWLSAETGLDLDLPTEAQWEKAARGIDGRNFPWGNEWNSSRINYCDKNCVQDWADKEINDGYQFAASVGNYPAGASPYSALDMAGNVWEWTADWYDSAYYNDSYSENPTGPESGERRVLRGGSWNNNPNVMRAAFRNGLGPDLRNNDVGFRLRLFSSPD